MARAAYVGSTATTGRDDIITLTRASCNSV